MTEIPIQPFFLHPKTDIWLRIRNVAVHKPPVQNLAVFIPSKRH